MRKSKLELYQEILEGLKGKPLSLECLSYETGMDCIVLRRRIDFLMNNGLVKERTLTRETSFVVSPKGMAVLKALDVQRHFEAVKTAVIAVENAMQTSMAVAKPQHKNE